MIEPINIHFVKIKKKKRKERKEKSNIQVSDYINVSHCFIFLKHEF